MHFNSMHEPSTVFTTGETFHSQMREVREHGSIGLPRFLLRFQKFVALFEDGIDGL